MSKETGSESLMCGGLERPAQNSAFNPTKPLWDELECRLQAKPSLPTSVPDLTNSFLAEWAQIPTDTLEYIVEILEKSHRCDDPVSTYLSTCGISHSK